MFVVIALLAVAQASQAPQPSQTVAAVNAGKKICRSMEKTGSLLRKKVCFTEEEWQAIDRQNRSNVDQMKDTPSRNRS
jgi:hypothetical protein